jgi:hypothetical protein
VLEIDEAQRLAADDAVFCSGHGKASRFDGEWLLL